MRARRSRGPASFRWPGCRRAPRYSFVPTSESRSWTVSAAAVGGAGSPDEDADVLNASRTARGHVVGPARRLDRASGFSHVRWLLLVVPVLQSHFITPK